MTTVLCLALCAAALLSALVFGGSPVLSLILAAAALAVALLRGLLFRKSRVFGLIAGAGGLVLLGLCLFVPAQPAEYGRFDHERMLLDYAEALAEGKSEDAETLYAALTEKYGESDSDRYLRAMDALGRKDANEAERIAISFDDRTSPSYYLILEEVYALRYTNPSDFSRNMRWLFTKASDDNPGWVYAAQNAGMLMLDDHDYTRARYYLARAWEQTDEPDGALCYYLGSAMYEAGDLEAAFTLFEQAVDLGVSEELQNYIAWYCEQYMKEVDAS